MPAWERILPDADINDVVRFVKSLSLRFATPPMVVALGGGAASVPPSVVRGLKAYARDIYLRFRTGMTGTPMPSFADVASEADMWDLANFVVSLARKPVCYLRTLPAVSNKVPAPTRPFLPVYLWGTFTVLILGGDPPMVFFAGNAGTAPETHPTSDSRADAR